MMEASLLSADISPSCKVTQVAEHRSEFRCCCCLQRSLEDFSRQGINKQHQAHVEPPGGGSFSAGNSIAHAWDGSLKGAAKAGSGEGSTGGAARSTGHQSMSGAKIDITGSPAKAHR